ncbi:MAG TPA: uracil-DNA glycosylase [Chloroflexota bacterium]|nr:uracil-DNA glycosylase [Chloroflexota bacterium]
MSTLVELSQEISGCQKCPLAKGRLKTVPGEGPSDARILFIGEAPGHNENQQGRPFVGAAGQLLEELLASIGLERSDVFITNVVKCRPPGNRDPQPVEIDSCGDYLDRQIKAIAPRVIVTLGRFSMARFFPRETISRIHGVGRQINGRLVFPMYHPAAALHQPSLRAALLEDMQKLRLALEEAERSRPVETSPPPTQLSLF